MSGNITLFTEVDKTSDPGFFIHFLNEANALPDIQRSKQVIIDGLRLHQGLSVLDVGCGTGTDVTDMARWPVGCGDRCRHERGDDRQRPAL